MFRTTQTESRGVSRSSYTLKTAPATLTKSRIAFANCSSRLVKWSCESGGKRVSKLK